MPSLCNKKEIQMLQFFCSELSLSRVQFLLLFLMALCYKLINFKIFNARKHKKTLKEQGWLSSKNFTKDPKFCKMNYANITKATPNKNTHCSYKTKSNDSHVHFSIIRVQNKNQMQICELIILPVAASL